MRPVGSAVIKIALVALMLWCLWLPLADMVRYPQRISVFPNLVTDAATYYDLARDLAATWHNNIPAKFPPLWIGLMASVFSATGPSPVAGKLISWIGLIVSVVLAAWLARRVYGSAAAWTAALLCASSAGLRAYVGTLQYEVTTAALLLASIALGVRASEAVTLPHIRWRVAGAGLAAALLILTRETFVIAVVMLAVWIACRARHTAARPRALGLAGLYLAAAVSLPLVWTIVQSTREGRVIVVAEKGPKEFALGNHPTANGAYNEPLVGMAEPAGMPFIRQYPRRAAVLFVRKALYFWGVLRDGWAAPQPLNVWIWRATTGVLPLGVIGSVVRGGWLVLALGISVWLLGRRGLAEWWVLPGIVIAIWAVHVVSLSSYRFGVPTLPLTYVIVSGPVAAMLRRMGKALRIPVIAIAACVIISVAVAAQYQNWPLQVTYEAVELDGLLAANEPDAVTGRPVRVADAKRGMRPAVLLADEYLPAGRLTATIRARRISEAPGVPGLQVVVYHLDGTPACLSDVPAGDLPRDRFADVAVSCHLRSDGPATLAVVTMGAADIAIERVNLRWHQ